MEQNSEMREVQTENKAPKSAFLSSILNRLITAATAVAFMLFAKLCLPEVYGKIKAAFGESYPARVSVSEVFDYCVDGIKDSKVFTVLEKEEKPAGKVLIKEENKIQTLAKPQNGVSPVSGGIIRRFGAYTDESGVRCNNPGVDIGVPLGSSVAAFSDGTVSELAENEDLGKYMIIDHGDGRTTLYAHLLCTFVPLEGKVVSGQRIALSGKCGERAMLHFEITLDGTHLDPLQYIDVW